MVLIEKPVLHHLFPICGVSFTSTRSNGNNTRSYPPMPCSKFGGKVRRMKKYILPMVVITIGIVCLTALHCLRAQSRISGRRGQLFFLHYVLITDIPGFTNSIPQRIQSDQDHDISWREQIAHFVRTGVNDQDIDDAKMFRSNAKNEMQTNYVAVYGNRTVWDENIPRNLIWNTRVPFDKIILIEIPDNEILWNSTSDYSVEQSLDLWSFDSHTFDICKDSGSFYVTLKGKIGSISEFHTQEEFRKMLVFSEDELQAIQNLGFIGK